MTPALKLSTLKLFNTGVGVSTYLKKTDFSFQMNKISVRGKQAENFLIQTFPHFRQTIIASEHSLAQIHSVFKHITLCIKEISGEDFKIEEAHTFQNFISNEISLNRAIQNDFILLLKKIISIEEFSRNSLFSESRKELLNSFFPKYKYAIKTKKLDHRTVFIQQEQCLGNFLNFLANLLRNTPPNNYLQAKKCLSSVIQKTLAPKNILPGILISWGKPTVFPN